MDFEIHQGRDLLRCRRSPCFCLHQLRCCVCYLQFPRRWQLEDRQRRPIDRCFSRCLKRNFRDLCVRNDGASARPFYPLPSKSNQASRQLLHTFLPFNIAHRGSNGEIPEETTAMYMRAIEEGTDFIKTYILSSKDGVLICFHDVALDDTTDVRLTPSLEVYSQLSKPEGVRECSMPNAAWKCTTQAQGSPVETILVEASEKISRLAIAWDRKVQIAKLVKSDLKDCGKWTLDSAAIGLTWLDDQVFKCTM